MPEGLPVVVYLLIALMSLIHSCRAFIERNDSAGLGWMSAAVWTIVLAAKHAGAI